MVVTFLENCEQKEKQKNEKTSNNNFHNTGKHFDDVDTCWM